MRHVFIKSQVKKSVKRTSSQVPIESKKVNTLTWLLNERPIFNDDADDNDNNKKTDDDNNNDNNDNNNNDGDNM